VSIFRVKIISGIPLIIYLMNEAHTFEVDCAVPNENTVSDHNASC